MGISFYSAVWPLIDRPLANFQIGLASTWILPDNSDNTDTPLAPIGTRAREWAERGPTWSSVFQTVEGGIGYWRGNNFRYNAPKFSMNATPQCYDYEIGSPGWSFFYSDDALPDDQLGIAQLSNRCLIPPDGLTFAGSPDGDFLGYAWMALPLTDATPGEPPTGDQSWTCFLTTDNFKGPIAFYIPETWSKIGVRFDEPFLYGRGLDTRAGIAHGGAMEINTVPRLDARDDSGNLYTKIPALKFPVNEAGEVVLVQDVTYYSKAALADSVRAWRNGGPVCDGRFDESGAFRSTLSIRTTRYEQDGEPVAGVENVFDTRIYGRTSWGLAWVENEIAEPGHFPRYFKQVDGKRVALAESEVPDETGLQDAEFPLATAGPTYTSPSSGAWTNPGPKSEIFTAELVDGSVVTYRWYRFIDQPSFQQYEWSAEKRRSLQALVEKIHRSWPIDRDYMTPLKSGSLVTLDPALIVTPPDGMEAGYVPIVIGQIAGAETQTP
ncbi:MAG: hypothetical protein ACOC0P_04150 [Planctomycetota bacterium]